MQRRSLFKLKTGNIGWVIHATRKNFSYSVVFHDEKNEYLRSFEDAMKIYRSELAKRSLAYKKRTGQKLQKRTATILSALVHLKKHHTLEDLKPILEKLEKDLDTKIISCAIHRDEGKLVDKKTGDEYYSKKDFALNPDDGRLYWLDDDKNFADPVDMERYEIQKNYHAHIEFLGIDSEGRSIKRHHVDGIYFSKMQDFVAKTLKMPRGKRGSKRKYKSVEDFKKEGAAKREIKKELEKKATIKSLKEINRQIREQLKEKGAQRPHYAKWEAFYKELQEYVKTEKPTMAELMERIGAFIGELLVEIADLKEKEQESEQLKEKLKEKEKEVEEQSTTLQEKERELIELRPQLSSAKKKNKELEEQLEAEKKKSAEYLKAFRRAAKIAIEAVGGEVKTFGDLFGRLEEMKKQLDEYKKLRYIERKQSDFDPQDMRRKIKELEGKIEELEAENRRLRAHNENLKAEIEEMMEDRGYGMGY